MNESSAEFVLPRPAATVVVVRPADDGPEVLMVKRHEQSSFASSYVFPGGVLEPDDVNTLHRCDNLSLEEANANLGIEADGLCYYSAAFREVLEETGVLLAEGPAASGIDNSAARDGLNNGTLRWADFLNENDLRLPCDRLHYIAYWVTPRTEPKRYSTRFFLAEMPCGQAATHDGGELTDSRWMKPLDVLQAGKDGDMKLPFVTRSTLRDIAGFGNLPDIIAWARSRISLGIAQLLPAFVTVDGKDRIVLPGSPHYPKDFDL